MVKKERGTLTEHDEEYLTSDKSLRAGDRDARMRIRNRARETILDYPLLVDHLDTRDREQTFFRPGKDGGRELSDDIENGLINAIAFYYLGLCDVAQSSGKSTDEWFSNIIKKGLAKGIEKWSVESQKEDRQVLTEFNLEFKYESEPLLKAENRYNQNNKLTAEEIALLVNADVIDDDRVFPLWDPSLGPEPQEGPDADLFQER